MDEERRHTGDHVQEQRAPHDNPTVVRDSDPASRETCVRSSDVNAFYDQVPVVDPLTGEVQEPSSGDTFVRSPSPVPHFASPQSMDSSFDTNFKDELHDLTVSKDYSVIGKDSVFHPDIPMNESTESGLLDSSFESVLSDDSPNKNKPESFFSPELQAELMETTTVVRDAEPVHPLTVAENGVGSNRVTYVSGDTRTAEHHKDTIEGGIAALSEPYTPEALKPFWATPSGLDATTLADDGPPVSNLATSPGTPSVVRDVDESTPQKKLAEKLAEIRSKPVEAEAEAEWQDITGSGALLKKTIKKGQAGTRPERGSVVTIKCSAKIGNDFEHSAVINVVDKNDDLRFTVGDVEVINGLELAVQLMDLGEISEVKMESRFAYGDLGHLEIGIPPNATLTYSVELVKVEPPVEPENLTVTERVTIANGKVDRGNFWYHRKEAVIALSLYQRAISILEAPNDKFVTADDVGQLNLAKARAYGNLSSAQVEERIWDEGLRSVNSALRYDPNNGKLWCRKIRIFREKGEFEQACEVCDEAISKGPLITETYLKKAREELAVLKKKKRVSDDKEKAMYQRMLGGSSKQTNGSSRPSPPRDNTPGTSNSTKKLLFFTAAAAIAVCGVFIGLRYYQNNH